MRRRRFDPHVVQREIALALLHEFDVVARHPDPVLLVEGDASDIALDEGEQPPE